MGEGTFGPSLHTVYPKGRSSVAFEVIGWPLRLRFEGRPQTFICICGYQQKILAEGVFALVRARVCVGGWVVLALWFLMSASG